MAAHAAQKLLQGLSKDCPKPTKPLWSLPGHWELTLYAFPSSEQAWTNCAQKANGVFAWTFRKNKTKS